MKILMSAFSCGPGQGSEPGVGWNWAIETARLGHAVTVVTSTEFEPLIRDEIASGRLPRNLRFVFIMPGWLKRLRDLGLRTRFKSATWFFTNLTWQILLPSQVRTRFPALPFDLVHHVTFATIRHTTCLGRLGLPLVLGPLGGGEASPVRLRRGLGTLAWLAEGVRSLHTRATRFDPISRRAFADASLIITGTAETKAVLPQQHWPKTICLLNSGIEPQERGKLLVREDKEPLRLIFVARLLAWKGLHLGLDALAAARRAGADVRLTVVGDGPELKRVRERATRLGLDAAIDWRGRLPRDELLTIYDGHHALIIPSLHDSGGMAVLEGLSRGLPVICLALGGPAVSVNDICGRAVSAKGSQAEVVARLRDAILEIDGSEALRLRLGEAALARADALTWSKIVATAYRSVAAKVGPDGRPAAGARSAPVELRAADRAPLRVAPDRLRT